METKDPALTKTPINNMDSSIDNDMVSKSTTDNELAQDTVQEKPVMTRDDNFHESSDKVEANTTVNKGTDTFDEEVVDSEHVNDGDNPARQPDRRDQEGGTAFDEGVNEDTVGSEAPKSEAINDMNRYANIDNAQSRTLNPDEKD